MMSDRNEDKTWQTKSFLSFLSLHFLPHFLCTTNIPITCARCRHRVCVPICKTCEWRVSRTFSRSSRFPKGKAIEENTVMRASHPFPFSLRHVDNQTTCLPASHISITLWKFATRRIITLHGEEKKEERILKEVKSIGVKVYLVRQQTVEIFKMIKKCN